MNQTDLLQQRKLLLGLSQRLCKDVRQLALETSDIHKKEGDYGSGEDTSDYQEVSNQAMEEFIARHMLGNQAFTLSEVEAALDRIKLGTYGTCSECHVPIGMERLKALPYARRCIHCAESLHG